jgi:hypothetical protein
MRGKHKEGEFNQGTLYSCMEIHNETPLYTDKNVIKVLMEQIEKPGFNPCTYRQLIFHKGTKGYALEKVQLFC